MLSKKVIIVCKTKLLEEKTKTLNRLQQIRFELNTLSKTGDEVDQSQANIEENRFVFQNFSLRQHLVEIELALARIQIGNFGVCEETDEPIEKERLATIPWTRLSIEGAEIRETLNKKYA